MKAKIRLIVLLSFVVVGFVVWLFLAGPLCRKDIRNVLLISIDTLRADYVGCYGYRGDITPNIDAFSKEGILFENVISPIPMTLPSHSTMLTGTIPPYHGVHDNLDYQLDQSNITLAEILKENGFKTAGIVSSFVLDSQFALDQGFGYYNDNFKEKDINNEFNERKGDETTKVALKWLEKNKDEKSFLFLHYYDPHSPYEPPEPFKFKFFRRPYAGEIAFADHCIGRVMNKLKELELYDSTLIIITSDHGEMLGEHGEPAHAYYIYQSAIRVPLIVKLSGESKPKRISDLVGLVDIVPTVCGLLGIEPKSQMQGDDLSPYLRKKNFQNQDRHVYCESLMPTKYGCSPLIGIVNNRFKYIQTTRPELYNLTEDPQEENNLVKEQYNRARVMKDRLEQLLEKTLPKDSTGSGMELDDESIRRLESLGYVAGDSVKEDFAFDQTKEDPKDWIGFHRTNAKALNLIAKEHYDEARKLCEQLLEKQPDFFRAYLHMAKICFKQNDIEGATSRLLEAGRIAPENFEIHNALGMALAQKGELDEAIKSFREALRLRPHRYTIENNIAKTLLQQKKYDEALEHFNKSIEIEPHQGMAYHNIGLIMAEKENHEEAIRLYRKSIELEPEHAEWFNNLSATLIKLERFDEALESYAKSLKLNNEQPVVYKIIGDIYHNRGKLAEAVSYFTKALELEQQMPAVQNSLAEIYFEQGNIELALKHWEDALEIKADWVNVLNNLAWIKAVYQQETFHNPSEAVKLAEKAVELTEHKKPDLLDTLSVAYAATGRFDEAIETAQKAIDLTDSSDQNDLADEVKKHLALYKVGKPYRQQP